MTAILFLVVNPPRLKSSRSVGEFVRYCKEKMGAKWSTKRAKLFGLIGFCSDRNGVDESWSVIYKQVEFVRGKNRFYKDVDAVKKGWG